MVLPIMGWQVYIETLLYCGLKVWCTPLSHSVARSVADPDSNPDPPDPDPPDPHVLGLLDTDQDPLVRGMDPDPDPSIIKQI